VKGKEAEVLQTFALLIELFKQYFISQKSELVGLAC
jgi:hypothetical protein